MNPVFVGYNLRDLIDLIHIFLIFLIICRMLLQEKNEENCRKNLKLQQTLMV